jgi:hypothetical protein
LGNQTEDIESIYAVEIYAVTVTFQKKDKFRLVPANIVFEADGTLNFWGGTGNKCSW